MKQRSKHIVPPVGSTFEKKARNGKKHVLTIVEVDGQIKYKVGDHLFNSPSSAAKFANGGTEANGWLYWNIRKYSHKSPPAVGSKFRRITKDGKMHVLTVVEVDGKRKYKVGNRLFSSPYGAAKSVNNGAGADGWMFWNMY